MFVSPTTNALSHLEYFSASRAAPLGYWMPVQGKLFSLEKARQIEKIWSACGFVAPSLRGWPLSNTGQGSTLLRCAISTTKPQGSRKPKGKKVPPQNIPVSDATKALARAVGVPVNVLQAMSNEEGRYKLVAKGGPGLRANSSEVFRCYAEDTEAEGTFNQMYLGSPSYNTATSALMWGMENVEFADVNYHMTEYLLEIDTLVLKALGMRKFQRTDDVIRTHLESRLGLYNANGNEFPIRIEDVWDRAFPKKEDDEPKAKVKVKVKKAKKTAKAKEEPAKVDPEPDTEAETGTDDEPIVEEEEDDFLDSLDNL